MNKKSVISISVTLILSVLFAVITNSIINKEDKIEASTSANDTSIVETTSEDKIESATEQKTESTTESTTEPITEKETQSTTEKPSEVVPKPNIPQAPFTTAPEGYFKKTLFIGDSRTVGLSEYGGIDDATFFASVGLSVYKIDEEIVSVANVGKVTLSELLKNKEFDSIYIMLGINEIGYNQKTTVKKYADLIDSIRKEQPNAIIYIEANIHVAKSLSDESDVYTNNNIDKLNYALSSLADNKTIFYIDVNEIFDDGHGNLDSKYTFDNTHLYGKYYKNWAEWLSNNVIIK